MLVEAGLRVPASPLPGLRLWGLQVCGNEQIDLQVSFPGNNNNNFLSFPIILL